MKKTNYIVIPAFLALALLVGIGVTSAQTNGATESKKSLIEQRQERLEQEKAKLEERKTKMASTSAQIEARLRERDGKLASTTARLQEREERRASSTEARRERLEERFKTGVSNQIAKVNDRLGDAIERLTKTDTRLKAHIAVLKAKNVDTAKADALLVDAEAKLATATEKVTTLATSLQSMLSGTISTTTKSTIKAKTAEANTYVKATHEAFVKVVVSLKPGINKTATSPLNGQATTTTP